MHELRLEHPVPVKEAPAVLDHAQHHHEGRAYYGRKRAIRRRGQCGPDDAYDILAGHTLTATTTRVWQSGAIKNVDVRVFESDNGDVMLYGFVPGSNYLLITVSRDTFAEVLTRLQTPSRVLQ